MRITRLKPCVGAFACAFVINAPAYALSITDAGVVGTVETGTQASNPTNELQWSNYLLGLGANTTDTADGNTPPDGVAENYETGPTDYNAVLTGGTQLMGLDPTGFQYVLAKYNGQNAGYVLFHVPDWQAAQGTDLPKFSFAIWGANPEQFQISHFTGFEPTGVPDGGATLLLLGAALCGLGVFRRFVR